MWKYLQVSGPLDQANPSWICWAERRPLRKGTWEVGVS